MEILIKNYLAGSHLLHSEPNTWDAIVILDSHVKESDFVNKFALTHLFLRFDDVTKSTPSKRAPSIQQIESAMKFGNDSDKLLVCCRAGQSRSAAIAFSIAYQKLGATNALALLNPKRHAPNQLIIDLAATKIDDASFMTVFMEWQASNSHIRLTDYIDEIASEMDALDREGAHNRILDS